MLKWRSRRESDTPWQNWGWSLPIPLYIMAFGGQQVRWREAPPNELRQGSGGGAPSGVQGRSPWWGVRGAKPPGKFLKNRAFLEHF